MFLGGGWNYVCYVERLNISVVFFLAADKDYSRY